jgi:hypothetical protein
MNLLEGIAGLFGRQKKIDQIPVEELKRERVTLEQKESRVKREVGTLESRKNELFMKGKDAASSRDRLDFARQVKDADTEIRGKDRDLAMIRNFTRVVKGLIQVKERVALFQDVKVATIISRLPVQQLANYVDRAMVGERLEMEKLATLLNAVEGGMDMNTEAVDDASVVAIAAAMEEARAADEAGRPEGVSAAADKVDQILARSQDSARET